MHKNLNWESIVTLIRPQQLHKLLIEAGYDLQKTRQLVTGFQEGFDIEYRGPMNRMNCSENLPFKIG